MRTTPEARLLAVVFAVIAHMVVTATCTTILIEETRHARAAYYEVHDRLADLLDQQDRRLAEAHDNLAHLNGLVQSLRSGQQSNGIHTATLGQWVREIYETCWFLPPPDRSIGVAAVPR